MEKKDFLYTVILTTTVFAALITSIANIIISLINSYRLKHIEEQKKLNEIDKYRYSRLHEILINWHKYDSEIKGETDSEIAFYRLLNQFMDDLGRYEIAKPLLDAGYTEELENKKIECENLLNNLVEAEAPDGTHTKDFPIIREKYFASGQEFSKLLKNCLHNMTLAEYRVFIVNTVNGKYMNLHTAVTLFPYAIKTGIYRGCKSDLTLTMTDIDGFLLMSIRRGQASPLGYTL